MTWFDGKKDSVHTSAKGTYVKCADSHPALPITVDGTTYHVYGGSGGSPMHSDHDIYVALDGSTPEHKNFFPWNNPGKTFVSFYINDMSVPKDYVEFRKMIVWLGHEVQAGRKVHVGCMGGHGRTGTVLAALVKHMTGAEDAINYVRKHYCPKAVESASQIEFLHKEFGINKVAATKEYTKSKKVYGSDGVSYGYADTFNSTYTKDTGSKGMELVPAEEFGSIWYPAD